MKTHTKHLKWLWLIAALATGLSIYSTAGDDDEHEEEEEREFSVVEIEQFLKTNLPIYSQQLAESKEESYHEYSEGLEMAAELMEEYYEILDEDKSAAETFLKIEQVESEIDPLVEQWHDANSSDRTAIEAKLRTQITKQIELEQIHLQSEIEHLKREISEIESELDQLQNSTKETIEEALRERLGYDDDDEHDEEQHAKKEKVMTDENKAPDFTLAGDGETNYTLSEQLKQGPVVLVFYRSGDW